MTPAQVFTLVAVGAAFIAGILTVLAAQAIARDRREDELVARRAAMRRHPSARLHAVRDLEDLTARTATRKTGHQPGTLFDQEA